MKGVSAAVLTMLAIVAATPQARANGFDLGLATDFGILYEGNGGQQLQYNNSNVTGNIGIGNTGQAQLNGPGTITGIIDFSAASTGQFSNSGVTLAPSVANPQYNVTTVTTALGTVNNLSQSLGLEAGTSTTITSGGSINASSGTLDASGNRAFTVTSISFPNGTFTVNGASTDYVVLNVAGAVGNNGLNGSIVLSGGITADHVLINYTPSTSNLTTYNNDYMNLTGGPTLTISTSGLTTTADFLDPTGNIDVNHSVVDGRLMGGDTQNLSFVSGANLFAPMAVPGPIAGAGLRGMVFAGGGLLAWWRRRRASSIPTR